MTSWSSPGFSYPFCISFPWWFSYRLFLLSFPEVNTQKPWFLGPVLDFTGAKINRLKTWLHYPFDSNWFGATPLNPSQKHPQTGLLPGISLLTQETWAHLASVPLPSPHPGGVSVQSYPSWQETPEVSLVRLSHSASIFSRLLLDSLPLLTLLPPNHRYFQKRHTYSPITLVSKYYLYQYSSVALKWLTAAWPFFAATNERGLKRYVRVCARARAHAWLTHIRLMETRINYRERQCNDYEKVYEA